MDGEAPVTGGKMTPPTAMPVTAVVSGNGGRLPAMRAIYSRSTSAAELEPEAA